MAISLQSWRENLAREIDDFTASSTTSDDAIHLLLIFLLQQQTNK